MYLSTSVDKFDQDHLSSRSFWRGSLHVADLILKVQATNKRGNTQKYVPCANLTAIEVCTKNHY